MDNTAACSHFCGEKQKKKNRGKERTASSRGRSWWRGKSSYFSLVSHIFSFLFTASLVEKSWRVFLAFSSPCGKMETDPALPSKLACLFFPHFSLGLFFFSHLSLLPMVHPHCFHFIHTFLCSPDSLPAPLTMLRVANTHITLSISSCGFPIIAPELEQA